MPNNNQVLWVDDDSPKSSKMIEGFHVYPVQSCRQAEETLNSGKIDPAFIIMDLILPQDGWGKEYMKLPGLNFIDHLRNKGAHVVVYTIVADKERREAALASGALDVYEKTKLGFAEVLRGIRHMIDKPPISCVPNDKETR